MDGAGASKRLQSKVTGGQSPERSRRKDKWATERQEVFPDEDKGTRRRRLQDPGALEDNVDDSNPKPFKRGRGEGFDAGGRPQRFTNPEYVPRSGYFFQHDDRSAWRPRPMKRRPFVDGPQVEQRKPVRKIDDRWTGGVQEEGGKEADNESRWRHDGFLQLENSAGNKEVRPFRGRPFENNGRFRDNRVGARRPGLRTNGRGSFHNTVVDRGRWGEPQENINRRTAPALVKPRPRPGGRELRTFGGTPGQDKWKHDLFDHASGSPASKREEESVAKAEALLAA